MPLPNTTKRLQAIYQQLYQYYGSQGWWPVVNAQGENIYHLHAPRNEDEQFEICVGAILTQNTQWEPNVVRALHNLKKENVLSRHALQQLSEERLGALIRSAGYYQQKAKKLKIFAASAGPIDRETLLSLWGIGPETADSILLYAYGQPSFVIDAYTQRIFSRLGFGEHAYASLQQLLMKHLPNDVELYKEYHALLVALGKDFCAKKNPRCSGCPLLKQCAYGKTYHA